MGLHRGDWKIDDLPQGTLLKYFTGFFMETEEGNRIPVWKKWWITEVDGDRVLRTNKVVDRVSMPDRILTNVGSLSPRGVCTVIEDYGVNAINNLEPAKRRLGGRIMCARMPWCIEYDGKSILCALKDHPEKTYDQFLTGIAREGGYIDKEGIIHRGNATIRKE